MPTSLAATGNKQLSFGRSQIGFASPVDESVLDEDAPPSMPIHIVRVNAQGDPPPEDTALHSYEFESFTEHAHAP